MPCEPSSKKGKPPSVVIAVDEPKGGSSLWPEHQDGGGGTGSVDYEALLAQPVLCPNPHFFWCHLHITVVAKILSFVYILIYFIGCGLVYFAGISITVLFTALFTGSVAAATLYGVFRWKKSCLIPFFLLQVILILNLAVLMFFLFYAMFATEPSTTLGRVQQAFVGIYPFSSITWMCILIYGLFLLELFFGYSIRLMMFEYEFIAAVDSFLKTIKRSSSNHSKDEPLPSTARMQL